MDVDAASFAGATSLQRVTAGQPSSSSIASRPVFGDNTIPLGLAAASFSALCAVHARRRQTRFLGPRRKAQVAVAVLPDGTNEEGEDLATPLGLTRDEVRDVVLYGSDYSPPCAKIRALLSYYKVPFKSVTGRHPTSDYKKIPVLEVSNRQVNDSHIIVKSVVPILTGKDWDEDHLAWERRITFEFQPAIEVELFGNGEDFSKVAGFDGWKQGLAVLLGPLLGSFIGFVFRSRYPDYQLPSSVYGTKFRAAMGDKPFFHGESPGPIDISLYGTYALFEGKGCQTTANFLKSSGLKEWHNRMTERLPAEALV